MGITKTHLFDPEINTWANLFKALGHPARLSIVMYLVQKRECVCTEIIDEIRLSQPTISRHLRVLKDANLIQGNISGPHVCYCINPEIMRNLETFLHIENQKINDNTCC